MQNSNTSSNYVTQVIELMQFIKGSFLQTIGINSQHNMKREYVNKGENGLNDDGLRPFVDNMLECRKQFVSEINETFGTEINVDFNSVWKRKQLEQVISSQLEKEKNDEHFQEDILEYGQYRGNDDRPEESSEGHSDSDRNIEPASEGRLSDSERNGSTSEEGAVNDESEQKSSTSKDEELNAKDEGRKTDELSSESDEEKDT